MQDFILFAVIVAGGGDKRNLQHRAEADAFGDGKMPSQAVPHVGVPCVNGMLETRFGAEHLHRQSRNGGLAIAFCFGDRVKRKSGGLVKHGGMVEGVGVGRRGHGGPFCTDRGGGEKRFLLTRGIVIKCE